MSRSPEVRLADVNEPMLERLLALALRDASPDEVTPPLGVPGWNPERIRWFRAYHRSAAGLDGPAQEKSWAVLCDGSPAGSIRLKRTAQGHTAETGIWLGRSHRGKGAGTAALALVLAQARAAGLREVIAHTTAGNAGARRLLSGAAAHLTYDDGGNVTAAVDLQPHRDGIASL